MRGGGGGGGGGGGAVEVAGARSEVIVGEAGGLHEGMDDGWTDEPEAPADHVFANGLGFGGLDWDLPACLVIGGDGFEVHEPP